MEFRPLTIRRNGRESPPDFIMLAASHTPRLDISPESIHSGFLFVTKVDDQICGVGYYD
jgi:hypothetical protein